MALASFLALICTLNFYQLITAENPNPKQTYIVHVESQSTINLDALYLSFLPMHIAAETGAPPPRILHSYRHVFKGFAAELSSDEVESMRRMEGFVSARPERVYQLHTTHSPSFLGLNQNAGFWKSSNYGKGVVIGLFDTGITPGHPSFSDHGMPDPPAKWKGKCDFGPGVCNKKLIGARIFGDELQTPADEEGHGTHTSSTAAGNFVAGANIFGNANGTSVGIAPLAHVAMYRVCSPAGCSESDIVAGLDAAIEDGVDVMSLSLGGFSAPFYSDNIALGAYRAIQKGIVVSCSAGNSGPKYRSTSNEAPWILTVGASTTDRRLTSAVVLGDGQELDGESAFQPRDFNSSKELEIFYRKGELCGDEGLNKDEVEGKIVLCELGSVARVAKGVAVKEAGGAAMILMNSKPQGFTLTAEAHVLPASYISYADTLRLKKYVTSSSNPRAKIVFKGTLIGDVRAPIVAYYSSRGPSAASPGILKPDIIGPGNNILAAWYTSPNNETKNNKANFNMISGTSMSCPHLSGVAALLKSAHPDWSPAAIKSAIMTTADQVNQGGKPIDNQDLLPADVFATGAGHVNPTKANDPGLIYDIHPDDYIPYLCGLNYTSQEVGLLVQPSVECSTQSSIPEAQLNYPSFSIKLGSTPQTYTRTVTNVGASNSSYAVKVVAPRAVAVNVNPARLEFSKVGQSLKYSVTFKLSGAGGRKDEILQGAIKWVSGRYSVSSPIAIVIA